METIGAAWRTSNQLTELSLVKLTKSGEFGAALIGAKAANYKILVDFSKNSEVFFHQVFDKDNVSDNVAGPNTYIH